MSAQTPLLFWLRFRYPFSPNGRQSLWHLIIRYTLARGGPVARLGAAALPGHPTQNFRNPRLSGVIFGWHGSLMNKMDAIQ